MRKLIKYLVNKICGIKSPHECNILLSFILFAIGGLLSSNSYAQENLPLNHSVYSLIDKDANSLKYDVPTSFKPINLFILNSKFNTDSLLFPYRDKDPKSLHLFFRKLRYENLIIIDTGDLHMTIDPLFNFEISKEKGRNELLYNNTRGIQAKGKIGTKFAFETSFYENQSLFNSYLKNYTQNNHIVPGQGFPKGFKDNGFDYAYATGLVSYSPNQYFNFQFGHGKNFIGDGYRSILLSDNAFNYPFFKITTNIWKFQYTNLYAQFLDLSSSSGFGYGWAKKFGTFHFLNFAAHKRFHIGLFESIIWQGVEDTITGKSRGFDINYLNPVIFYRPIEYSLGSPDNALIGLNMKFKITNSIYLYGQFVIDDFDVAGMKKGKGYILEKYGYQAGVKFLDILNIKHLQLQTEVNQVQPYVYAHKDPKQNYSHYNQSLAHPLGANFIESVSIIRYRIFDFALEAKFNFAIYGADTANSHWGKDIFKSDEEATLGYPSWGNKVTQGVKTTLMYKDIRVSYIINPKTNMNISLGITNRTIRDNYTKKDDYFVFLSLRTSLTNFYYDF